MGRASFVALVETSASRRFRRAAEATDRIVRDELHRELGPRLLRVSRQAAPERRGALARGLRQLPGRGGRISVEVVSTVRSEDGYPYTGVTRFGHRRPWIYPRRGRALATPWGPRARVRGYRPTRDWAEEAHRLAQPHVARSSRQVGRRLAAEVTR